MKRKYIPVILSVIMITVSGCSNKDVEETVAAVEATTEIESSTVEETTETESSVIEEPTEAESETETEETSEIEAETEEVTLEENTSEATTEVEVLEAEPYIMYVASNCNVRREADKKSELIMTLAKGVEVTCYGTEGDWTQIDCQGIVAYIHTSLLTSTKPASSSTSSTGSSSQSGSTQSQQTQTPAQSTTPTQSSGGKTTVNYKGVQMTLTPNGKGWYLDQDGIDRDAQGNPVDPITGQPYDTTITYSDNTLRPLDELDTNSGLRAE